MESVGAAGVPRGLQPSVGRVTEGFCEAHVLRIVFKWLVEKNQKKNNIPQHVKII